MIYSSDKRSLSNSCGRDVVTHACTCSMRTCCAPLTPFAYAVLHAVGTRAFASPRQVTLIGRKLSRHLPPGSVLGVLAVKHLTRTKTVRLQVGDTRRARHGSWPCRSLRNTYPVSCATTRSRAVSVAGHSPTPPHLPHPHSSTYLCICAPALPHSVPHADGTAITFTIITALAVSFLPKTTTHMDGPYVCTFTSLGCAELIHCNTTTYYSTCPIQKKKEKCFIATL